MTKIYLHPADVINVIDIVILIRKLLLESKQFTLNNYTFDVDHRLNRGEVAFIHKDTTYFMPDPKTIIKTSMLEILSGEVRA